MSDEYDESEDNEAENDDVYSNFEVENLREDDEIDASEAGFMYGYNVS